MSDVHRWESRYTGEEAPPWDTGRVSLELQRFVNDWKIRPCRALELGCGTGTNAIWLAQQGFEITGVDISPTAILRAKKRAQEAPAQVKFEVADITTWNGGERSFEFFFDRGCYHAVRRDDARAYFDGLRAWTAPNCVGLVLTGNAREERKPGPPTVSETDLRKEWGADFEILRLDEFRFDQEEPDGHRHLGWSVALRKK